MTIKQYLRQSVSIREAIFYLRERIEKIRTDLEYHPIQLDDTGASHLNYRTDKLSEKMAEIADLQTEYETKRLELEKKDDEIRQTIELLENTEYRAVLTARYLTENRRYPFRLNTWFAVANMCGLDGEESARAKHNRAVKILEKNFICERS